ncbi:uncharacterized protein, partial [Eucyclogobius newberryi]|uniref:uncharacterized protein n=1 Tax=Eucyclogobius newberryi TaxID=166745 RepID=UPI003B59A184
MSGFYPKNSKLRQHQATGVKVRGQSPKAPPTVITSSFIVTETPTSSFTLDITEMESQSQPTSESDQAAKIPEAPEVPEVLEVPKYPEAPGVMDLVSEAPEVLNLLPEAPGVMDLVSEAPGVMDLVSEVPEVLNLLPEAPGVMDLVSEAPEVLNLLPEAPGVMEQRTVDLSVELKDPGYKELLEERDALQYDDLSQHLQEQMHHAFLNLPGFKALSVLEISPVDAGISVHYSLLFESPPVGPPQIRASDLDLHDLDLHDLDLHDLDLHDLDLHDLDLHDLIRAALRDKASLPIDLLSLHFSPGTK